MQYCEGKFRTYAIDSIFLSNTLGINENGLLKFEKPTNLGTLVPSSTRDGNRIRTPLKASRLRSGRVHQFHYQPLAFRSIRNDCKQKNLSFLKGFRSIFLCTRGGNRTRTPLKAQDFKSCVSTSSTTRALACSEILR